MNLHFLPCLICQRQQIIPLRTQEYDMCMDQRIIFWEMREGDEMHVLKSWRCSQTADRHSDKLKNLACCTRSISFLVRTQVSAWHWEMKRRRAVKRLACKYEPLSVRDEWEAWRAADDHSIILTEGQKARGSAFLTEMNYTYLSWNSAALVQAKETINNEESVSVCYFVSKSVNISKQAKTAQFILLLFLIITSKNGIDSTVLLNCQLPFSCCPLFPSLLLLLQWWESVHQADCFPAETRSGPKEEGIKGTQPHIPLCVSWLMRVYDQPFLLSPTPTPPFATSSSTAVSVLSSQTHTALNNVNELLSAGDTWSNRQMCWRSRGW